MCYPLETPRASKILSSELIFLKAQKINLPHMELSPWSQMDEKKWTFKKKVAS